MDDLTATLLRPQLRAGVTVRRAEIARRAGAWIIRTPEGRHLLVNEPAAALLSLFDGARTVADLAAAAATRWPVMDDPQLVARLIAQLAEKGVLEGSEARLARAVSVTRRVHLADPTPLLELLCRLVRAVPSGALVAALMGLGVGGILGAVHHTGELQASLSLSRLWDRLPATASIAWLMGVWHELAHGLATVLHGGRVRSIGIAQTQWRVLFCIDIPDLILLPRRVRMRIAAAGPLGDAALGSAALLVGWLLPALEDLSWPVATAALLRTAWNLLPALRTDGAFLLSEVLGEPGLEHRARRELATWFLVRSRSDKRLSRRSALALYGLLSVALEAGVLLVVGGRIAHEVLRMR